MKRLIIAAIALALSACATVPTLYQAALGPRAVGFSESRIEPDRYRVTFRGGPGAPASQVEDYALIRAADLALAGGFDWFRVADRRVEQLPDTSPRLGLGLGSADFGRRSAVGVDLGTSFSLGGGPAVVVSMEILMGRGERPGDRSVYDARAVRRTLGERI